MIVLWLLAWCGGFLLFIALLFFILSRFEPKSTLHARLLLPYAFWLDMRTNLILAQRQTGTFVEIDPGFTYSAKALNLYTRTGKSVSAAGVHDRLGVLYRLKDSDDLEANREIAVDHAKQAVNLLLSFGKKRIHQLDLAKYYCNLGIAYSESARGEKEENFSLAMRSYRNSLKEWQEHAVSQFRVYGKEKEALEDPSNDSIIDHMHIRSQFPIFEQWTVIYLNLSRCLLNDPTSNKQQSHAEAIERLTRLVQVCASKGFERFRFLHQGQVALATAYWTRTEGDRTENLTLAIELSQEAARRFNELKDSAGELQSQELLGKCYQELLLRSAPGSDRYREYASLAAGAFEQALAVEGLDRAPEELRELLILYGDLMHSLGRWEEARSALARALTMLNQLRKDHSRDAAKRSIAASHAGLFEQLVNACLQLNDIDTAFTYAAAGKGWAFVDLLASSRPDPNAGGADDPAMASDLQKWRLINEQIDESKQRLLEMFGEEDDPPEEHGPALSLADVMEVFEEGERSVWDDLTFHHPKIDASIVSPTLTAPEAMELARELGSLLLEFYRDAGGWSVFVVRPDGIDHARLPNVDGCQEELSIWTDEINEFKGGGELDGITHRRWYEAIFTPLRERDLLPNDIPVVIAPFSWLHLMPFGALPNPSTSEYFCDEHLVSFVPSLSALAVTRSKAQTRNAVFSTREPDRALCAWYSGVRGSRHYLPHIWIEAEEVVGQLECRFTSVMPLPEERATVESVIEAARDAEVVHFGCHGTFDANNPHGSGLRLADGWLTVQRILAEMRLTRARMVSVAACLGGRIDVRGGEEHVGLVQALMTSGAQSVVAGLWEVPDASTQILFKSFYANVVIGQNPMVALREATKEVRKQPGSRHPFHWAAFQAYGLVSESIVAPSEECRDSVSVRAAFGDAPAQPGLVRGLAAMSERDIIRRSEVLLAKLLRSQKDLSSVLTERECLEIRSSLNEIEARSSAIENDADLFQVADSVLRLIENNATLRRMLLPEGSDPRALQQTREVTLAMHLRSLQRNKHAMSRIVTLLNRRENPRDFFETSSDRERSDDQANRDPDFAVKPSE